MKSVGINGFLSLIKPPGMTSFDLIRALRRKWPKEKMGHSGTLDLPACGVVVVALGNATKFLSYLLSRKEYVFEVVFGLDTETFDLWGKVIEKTPMEVDEGKVKNVLPQLEGRILQEVPSFSSKREKGKRFYQIAQEDLESVPKREAEVEIFSLELLDFLPGEFPRARLFMSCSAGTYVRSLARELGRLAGGIACAGFIVRVRSGPFTLENSFTLEEVLGGESSLVPVEEALSHFPQTIIPDRYLSQYFNGHPFPSSSALETGEIFRLKDRRGNFLGLARACGKGILKAEKVFK
ncbi:MAG: tRNA pseudouridine(55) synthase TruB [Caldiserica bacterium]|jgi:tRNA pseudouridine55 synthase|nr:tRNA pseudouridine(55) synthase TruB [Caldisericota bacterium]MDH7562784.1 tRNA pseudouridine(55) synthase TruB [Caldisericota bacterium]